MANWAGRFMTAVRVGIQAFQASEQALIPDPIERSWDLYDSRNYRYYHLESYYNNTQYAEITQFAAAHRYNAGLYRHIRGVYNPFMRGCDLFAANVYPGPIDMENFAKGAIPIAGTKSAAFKEGFRQLMIWSNWQAQKTRYVRDTAKYGDVFIKVCDDPFRQKVYLELLHPGLIKDMQVDSRGNITSIVIEYTKTDESLYSPLSSSRRQETYTYTEVITKEAEGVSGKFQTYRNGQPYAYYKDENGAPIAEWDNEYGFVPIVHAKFKDIGLTFGGAAFHGMLRKIDELNDATSNALDQARKAVTPLWFFAGVEAEGDLDASVDSENKITGLVEGKDRLRALYGPTGSQPFPMVAPLDFAAVFQQYMGIFAEIQRDMPILSLPEIRQQIQATAPGVQAAFQDGIGQIIEAQGSLDEPFRRAVQMAFSIGALRRYKNFTAFTPYSYEKGDLDFYIPVRPVIKDELTKGDKITFLVQTNAPQKAVWKELDYTDDVIEEWTAEIDQTQQAQELQVQRQVELQARAKQDAMMQQPMMQPGQQPQQVNAPDQRPAIPERVA